MSNLTDFFPSGGGGGLTPKFEEFNSSGTFTPSQELIDAGGYIEVFLVGAGSSSNNAGKGGGGGEVIIKKMYLTSTNNCTVTIGAAGAVGTSNYGGNSIFDGTPAGGVSVTSTGGNQNGQVQMLGAGFGALSSTDHVGGGSGVMGYGAGGAHYSAGGVLWGKANSGQGSNTYNFAGSGYCLIKWYE